jgi:hypothetical protein
LGSSTFRNEKWGLYQQVNNKIVGGVEGVEGVKGPDFKL